jgi:broad specificity phosphatase PhoE
MISPNLINLTWIFLVVFLFGNSSLWKCVHCFQNHQISQVELRVYQVYGHQIQTIKQLRSTSLFSLGLPNADLPELDGTMQNPYSSFDTTNVDLNRRFIIATTPIVTAFRPSIAYSAITHENTNQFDSSTTASMLNCLQDLPSYNRTTTVRLFLCRHGETDYNRNNIIQGARIDPPINNVGIQQAKLLGQTLQRVHPKPSTIIVHSPLLRTQQTAQVVAEQMFTADNNKRQHKSFTLRSLDALAEADFGSVAEGAPVSQYRKELISLYTSWATGNYDAHMKAGGESGTEVSVTINF